MAYGRVDGLSRLSCCCADMPSPPPPPPMPPPSPAPPPQFPRLPPSLQETQMESEWGRGIVGSMDAPPPSPPPVLEHTEATSSGTATMTAGLGTFGFALLILLIMRLVRILRDPMRFVPKPPKAGDFKARARGDDGCTQPMMEADEESAATTKLHIEVSPEERCALKISMDTVSDMADLQDLVAEVCDEAGYRDLDDLVMTYKAANGVRADISARQCDRFERHPPPPSSSPPGHWHGHLSPPSTIPTTNQQPPDLRSLVATIASPPLPPQEYSMVTRSVTIGMLKASPALRLAPASTAAAKKKKKKGKSMKA